MDRTVSVENLGVEPELLVRKYQAGLWRYLRTLGASPDLADDLTQSAFLAVFRSRFVHEAWPKTWSFLKRVAYNLFVDEHRRRGRADQVELIEERDLAWSEWFGDEGPDEEMIMALRDCVGSLTPRARYGIELRYRDQLSREKIAAALEMSPDGAKNLLQRAKQRLRECLERKRHD
ncbi:MAG TPA: sigma-70 family RNA polymerase sigma factor [Planctomycetaceae bacterium]|nr:sigma-70 family RNA polymerase sigma factor [Planctomycetaceae bacterium]HRE99043.1 sigma-70 family RNA polymerase sigma factor [Pirellulaceae bacterium]